MAKDPKKTCFHVLKMNITKYISIAKFLIWSQKEVGCGHFYIFHFFLKQGGRFSKYLNFTISIFRPAVKSKREKPVQLKSTLGFNLPYEYNADWIAFGIFNKLRNVINGN